jgi:hypothetical protein
VATVPLGPFVRFVILGATAVYTNWNTITGLFDRAVTGATQPIFGYYVQHCFQMKDGTGAFTDKERGLNGVHWINTTGGDLDTTWTAADYALIETGFQTLWTSLGGMIPNEVRLVEHRWYAFGPGVAAPNPPVRVTTLATPIQGTGTVIQPHQVSSTITFRTSLRRHWGRIYLPIYASTANIVAGGQLSSGAVDAIASAGSSYIKSGNANGLAPVIWDRNRKSALGVTSVEVDSVPDIIRRRRPRQTNYRKILTS